MQKKSYKVLAYLCEARPDFLQPHFQEVRQWVPVCGSNAGCLCKLAGSAPAVECKGPAQPTAC